MNGGLVNWMPGFSRYYHGQQYWCRGSETYFLQRRDKYVTITVIENRCADCDAAFITKVPDSIKLQPNRRCQNCKAPDTRPEGENGRRRRARRLGLL